MPALMGKLHAAGEERVDKGVDEGHRLYNGTMSYFSHTAETATGEDLDQEHWQPLPEHLRNVADKAREFAEPLGLADAAEQTCRSAPRSGKIQQSLPGISSGLTHKRLC